MRHQQKSRKKFTTIGVFFWLQRYVSKLIKKDHKKLDRREFLGINKDIEATEGEFKNN